MLKHEMFTNQTENQHICGENTDLVFLCSIHKNNGIFNSLILCSMCTHESNSHSILNEFSHRVFPTHYYDSMCRQSLSLLLLSIRARLVAFAVDVASFCSVQFGSVFVMFRTVRKFVQ